MEGQEKHVSTKAAMQGSKSFHQYRNKLLSEHRGWNMFVNILRIPGNFHYRVWKFAAFFFFFDIQNREKIMLGLRSMLSSEKTDSDAPKSQHLNSCLSGLSLCFIVLS